MSNGLGGDTFTRNLTGGLTDGGWTDFSTELIYSFFQKKKKQGGNTSIMTPF